MTRRRRDSAPHPPQGLQEPSDAAPGDAIESAPVRFTLAPADLEQIRAVVRAEVDAALAAALGDVRARRARPSEQRGAQVDALDRAAALRLAREIGLPLSAKGRRG